MKKITQFVAFGLLTAALTFAEDRSGKLVDLDCYQMYERNLTQKDPDVTHDRDLEIRECAPKAKTRAFGVVPLDGEMFKLDPAGNAKAAELVRDAAKKSTIHVSVTGEMGNHSMKVDSLAIDPGW